MGKAVVHGVLERSHAKNESKVKAKVVPNTRTKTLVPIIHESVEIGSHVYTDKLPTYNALAADFIHEAIDHAMTVAAEVPLKVTRDAASVLGLAAVVAEKGNANAVSDAGTAAGLALASARAAALNVRINAGLVKDREAAKFWLDEVAMLEHTLSETYDSIAHTIRIRMNP